MSTWVRVDCRFDHHSATLYIGRKQMLMEQAVFAVLQNADNPARLELACRDLILKYRPELAGCEIYAMSFNLEWARWEFSVIHASLPATPMHERSPMIPLDPAYEKDMLATAEITQ